MTFNLPTISSIRLTVLFCLLTFHALALQAKDFQSLASMRMQSESFIMNYPYESPYPPAVQLGILDSRLRLKACPEALSIDFARRSMIKGNTAILVRCPIKSGWKIHLPVRIDVFDDVAVAAKPLLKGQNIDDAAVTFQKQNIARLKNGYYAKKSSIHQLQSRRNLARGTVLTPANLSPRLLVRSGQQVTLVLTYNGLQIKSSGKALQSASLGQVVRVRNSQSQKVVEGVVSGEALVRVSI
ncbi:MAG: flagellar basal body P-ring formation protein FlgA [Gammaproteobacteria bacterium]|nr:flagellar basal body P-ring formation protein FlgA [Gammaproteobacteria bacterium]